MKHDRALLPCPSLLDSTLWEIGLQAELRSEIASESLSILECCPRIALHKMIGDTVAPLHFDSARVLGHLDDLELLR